jgi:hypothetical protein
MYYLTENFISFTQGASVFPTISFLLIAVPLQSLAAV